jgi:hypothetical protein
MVPRGATLVRRILRCRRTQQVRCATRLDTLRPGNGGVSGGSYSGKTPFRSATPRSIQRPRSHRLAPSAGSLSCAAAPTLPVLRRFCSIARKYSSQRVGCQSDQRRVWRKLRAPAPCGGCYWELRAPVSALPVHLDMTTGGCAPGCPLGHPRQRAGAGPRPEGTRLPRRDFVTPRGHPTLYFMWVAHASSAGGCQISCEYRACARPARSLAGL